jgi:NADPH-dependent glutamate synthase beta subunit-like oxidoreductase
MKHILILVVALLVASIRAYAADTNPPAKTIPVRSDVLIYGATPAGIKAAIAADRAGASVVLLEHGKERKEQNPGAVVYGDKVVLIHGSHGAGELRTAYQPGWGPT